MPGPRELLPLIVDALGAVVGERLEALALAGSVAKDDWIPMWSDLDLHVFLADLDTRPIAPTNLLSLQERLGAIDRSRFGLWSLQVLLFDATGYPADFIPPARRNVEMLLGALPASATASSVDIRAKARADLRAMDQKTQRFASRVVSATDVELPQIVRQLAGLVKDASYAVAVLRSRDPDGARAVKRRELSEVVGAEVGCEHDLSIFFDVIERWSTTRMSPPAMRAAVIAGLSAVDRITRWFADRRQAGALGRRVRELRAGRRWSQEKLSEATERMGVPVSVRTIRRVERQGIAYVLPRKWRQGGAKIEAIARAFGVDIADLLLECEDAEIQASCFVGLLGEVRLRRAARLLNEEVPRSQQEAVTPGHVRAISR